MINSLRQSGFGARLASTRGADFAEYALLLAGVVLGANIAALAERVAGLLGGS